MAISYGTKRAVTGYVEPDEKQAFRVTCARLGIGMGPVVAKLIVQWTAQQQEKPNSKEPTA